MDSAAIQFGQAASAFAAEPGSLDPAIRQALATVPTFAAVLVRVSAMFLFAPLFGSGRIPKRIRAMIAVVLALSLTSTVKPFAMPNDIYTLVVGAAGELIFGLAMGTVMSLTFIAAQWAGEIVGQQLGFNLGETFDPQFGAGGSVVSDMLFMLTLVIFLCLRGHHAMLMGLKESFSVLPPFTAGIGPGGINLLIGLMTSCTVLAIKLTAPVLVTMLVSDVALGFISKTMPQLNVMSAGMSLRGMLGIVIIAGGMVYTNETMSKAVTDSMIQVRNAWVTDWRAN